ncbi:hypothetical protein FB157_11511 [Streptomyces sp. BK340]|nr:hypothetical protein FB157_11511 [Streptomyces sp. BK340]
MRRRDQERVQPRQGPVRAVIPTQALMNSPDHWACAAASESPAAMIGFPFRMIHFTIQMPVELLLGSARRVAFPDRNGALWQCSEPALYMRRLTGRRVREAGCRLLRDHDAAGIAALPPGYRAGNRVGLSGHEPARSSQADRHGLPGAGLQCDQGSPDGSRIPQRAADHPSVPVRDRRHSQRAVRRHAAAVVHGDFIKEGSSEIWDYIDPHHDARPMHVHLVNCQVPNRQPIDAAAYRTDYHKWIHDGRKPKSRPVPAKRGPTRTRSRPVQRL